MGQSEREELESALPVSQRHGLYLFHPADHPIFMVYSIWKGLPDPLEYPDDLLIKFVDTSFLLLNSLN